MKDGHLNVCKQCVIDTNRERRQKNRAKYNAASAAQQRRWRATNPKKYRATIKAWQTRNRERHLHTRRLARIKKYGLSTAEAESVMKARNGLCDICGGPPDGRHKKLVVDHDHTTGRVRGLLCNGCNRGIGYLKDDPKRLRAALRYLGG